MTEVNTNIELQNDPNVALGLKAADQWKRADKANGRGDAFAIAALFGAWHTKTFVARIYDRKTDALIEESPFDLADYAHERGITKLDGTKDKKLVSARLEAISETVFGVADPDQAMKVRILRTLKIVAYLADKYELGEVTISKRDELLVPYTAMFSPPKSDASTNEQNKYEAMKDKAIALDGKEGNSIAALARKANPPKERAPHSNGDDEKGASFKASVTYVTTMLAKLNSHDDESDFALSDEMRKQMFDLQAQLATYFEADPFDDEKEQKQPKRNTRASK